MPAASAERGIPVDDRTDQAGTLLQGVSALPLRSAVDLDQLSEDVVRAGSDFQGRGPIGPAHEIHGRPSVFVGRMDVHPVRDQQLDHARHALPRGQVMAGLRGPHPAEALAQSYGGHLPPDATCSTATWIPGPPALSRPPRR
ncbi:MAG TPA: hypothetical protein EYM39_13235 [Candidatus Latescibacteria bacterium]|nr:hypothetical protein [Candidatus Latescibacterota bacterium]